MKFLIAEDEFINRKILSHMLSNFGNCSTVTNGREALEEFERGLKSKEPYKLVCLDIMMPEMNGQKVLKAIRAMEMERGMTGEAAAKIIMVTSLSDSPTINKAFLMECNGYLVKPINKARLINQLAELGFHKK